VALKVEAFHVPLQALREVFLVNILDYPVANDINIAFFFFVEMRNLFVPFHSFP
jgi:hypothetical protein